MPTIKFSRKKKPRVTFTRKPKPRVKVKKRMPRRDNGPSKTA
jgi:hypothetical protein